MMCRNDIVASFDSDISTSLQQTFCRPLLAFVVHVWLLLSTFGFCRPLLVCVGPVGSNVGPCQESGGIRKYLDGAPAIAAPSSASAGIAAGADVGAASSADVGSDKKKAKKKRRKSEKESGRRAEEDSTKSHKKRSKKEGNRERIEVRGYNVALLLHEGNVMSFEEQRALRWRMASAVGPAAGASTAAASCAIEVNQAVQGTLCPLLSTLAMKAALSEGERAVEPAFHTVASPDDILGTNRSTGNGVGQLGEGPAAPFGGLEEESSDDGLPPIPNRVGAAVLGFSVFSDDNFTASAIGGAATPNVAEGAITSSQGESKSEDVASQFVTSDDESSGIPAVFTPLSPRGSSQVKSKENRTPQRG